MGFSASPYSRLPCLDLGCLGLVSKNSGKTPQAKSSGSLPSSLINERHALYSVRCASETAASRLSVALHRTQSAYTSRAQHPSRQWLVLRSEARAALLRLARLLSGPARRACYMQHATAASPTAWAPGFKLHGAAVLCSMVALVAGACHLVEAGLKLRWPALTRSRGLSWSLEAQSGNSVVTEWWYTLPPLPPPARPFCSLRELAEILSL